jgi:hypothetical protein
MGGVKSRRNWPPATRHKAFSRQYYDVAKIPRATHEGILTIGGTDIACANLDNGMRVITQSGFMLALKRARQAKGRQYYDADVNMPAFLTAKNLKPFVPDELAVTSSQLEFYTLGGMKAFGYSAELLPKVCYVYIDAKEAGKLKPVQDDIYEQAKLLIRGLAHVGIIPIDDAPSINRELAFNCRRYSVEALAIIQVPLSKNATTPPSLSAEPRGSFNGVEPLRARRVFPPARDIVSVGDSIYNSLSSHLHGVPCFGSRQQGRHSPPLPAARYDEASIRRRQFAKSASTSSKLAGFTRWASNPA